MKKVFCILLAAMLMLSLTACVQQPDGTTGNGAHTTTVPVGTGAPEGIKIDLNDGWTVGFASSGSFSDVGYYYLSDSFLYFMDTENGNSVILCSKAGCQHDKAEDWDEIFACEAYVRSTTVFFYYDGHLYYEKFEKDNPNAIHLYRRNADGTGEEKVATLCEEFFSQTTEAQPGEYIIADGMMYYTAAINEITQPEPNNFVIQKTGELLMRLDLKTGKEKEILRLKDAYIYLQAARKDALIFQKLDSLPYEEMVGPLGDKMDNMPTRLQIWTESSGTATTIFEKTDEQCWMVGVYGGKAYYVGRNEFAGRYTYDFATGEHATANLPENSKIINENYWSVYDFEEFKTTIYDFRTGKPVSGDFADWSINFREVGEKGGIVDLDLFTGITPESVLISAAEIYGYVPFAAMEDGLQKEDILIISEKEY